MSFARGPRTILGRMHDKVPWVAVGLPTSPPPV